MLTADLVRPRVRVRRGEIETRPLPIENVHVLRTAVDLIRIFSEHVDRPRRDLDAALEEYEGVRLDYIVIRGMAKVLQDAATFQANPAVDPVALRSTLFAHSAHRGPVVAREDRLHPELRDGILAETAVAYGVSVGALEQSLYADLTQEQILTNLEDLWTPEGLIARYNLELARGLLYWASEMRITVHDTYKDLFKFIKLFKLMHVVRPIVVHGQIRGYAIALDGPISPFVRATLRYGGQMARFLPALMLCSDWQMEADVHATWLARDGQIPILPYRLGPDRGLRSHYRASGEYDSRLEEDFVAEFEAKFSRTERKWELAREDEIIPVGDTVMIPDFSFTHVKDGRRALVELAGFWHPDYLKRKAWKLREAGRQDLIVVAYRSVNTTDETWADVPGEVLLFTSKPVIKDVLAAVERCAVVRTDAGRPPLE